MNTISDNLYSRKIIFYEFDIDMFNRQTLILKILNFNLNLPDFKNV